MKSLIQPFGCCDQHPFSFITIATKNSEIIGVSDDKVKDDAVDFGDTTEFEPVADSYGNDSENAFDKAADDAASKEYKNCDTESLPCVSMDENGGYTVHKNR